MKCPKDGSALEKELYEADIEVDRCSKCSGVWLDHGELEKAQEATEHDYSQERRRLPDLVNREYLLALERARPQLSCPACARDMERREHGHVSQILIDVCPSCRGIWLDQGEMEALEVFYEKSRFEATEVRQGFLATLRELFS